MDLKKLYKDVLVLLGTELETYTFLTLCDMAACAFLSRYPKKLVLSGGEYITPETLESSFAISDLFSNAVLLYVIGNVKDDKTMLENSNQAADEAYISLWRAASRGKHIKNERW